MVMYIVFFNTIFINTSSIGGWSQNEILILVVFCGLIDSLFTFFLNAGVGEIPQLINQGTLDFILLKPINRQFYLSIRKTTIPLIYNIIINIILLIYLIKSSNIQLSLQKIFAFSVLTVNGVFVIYCFTFILMSLSFWFIKMDVIFGLLPEIITIGNKPFKIYPNIIQKIFTYVIPLAITFNYPVVYLVKGLDKFNIAAAFAVSFVFFSLSRFVFKQGLKKYSSASS